MSSCLDVIKNEVGQLTYPEVCKLDKAIHNAMWKPKLEKMKQLILERFPVLSQLRDEGKCSFVVDEDPDYGFAKLSMEGDLTLKVKGERLNAELGTIYLRFAEGILGANPYGPTIVWSDGDFYLNLWRAEGDYGKQMENDMERHRITEISLT